MTNYFINPAYKTMRLIPIDETYTPLPVTGYNTSAYNAMVIKKYLKELNIPFREVLYAQCWYNGEWTEKWFIRFNNKNDSLMFKLRFNPEKISACIKY